MPSSCKRTARLAPPSPLLREAGPPQPSDGSNLATRDGLVSVVEYGSRRLWIVVGIMLAALLQTLDATIVNVALPTIQGNLGASIDEGTWVVTAYIIAAVVVMPLAPWLQTRFGRKRYYLVSICGFTAASLACGLSNSIGELIDFRLVQGVFGGGLLATSQAILRDTFPPAQLGISQSIYAIGVVVGPSIGPILGGILTDNASWNWVFDVNLVPGAISFVLMLALLRDPAKPRHTAFDGVGLLLLALGLGSLQYVFDQGERNDWFSDPSIVLFSMLAAIGLTAFVAWEYRGAHSPIVDVRVLFSRNVIVGCLVAAVYAQVVFGQLLLLPQFLTGILGFTATDDGVLLALRAIPVALLTLPVGMLAGWRRVDPRYLIVGGVATAGAATVALAWHTTSGTSFERLAPYLVLAGFGFAFAFTPLLVVVLRALPGRDAPKAAAFITLAFNLGGSIASAALITLLDRRTSFHSSVLGAHITLHAPAVAIAVAHGRLAALARLVMAQATTLAYADTLYVMGVLAVLLAPLALLLCGPRREATQSS